MYKIITSNSAEKDFKKINTLALSKTKVKLVIPNLFRNPAPLILYDF